MKKILLSEQELNESKIISQIQNDVNGQIANLTIQIESLKFQRKNAIEEFSIFEEKNKAFYEEIANKYGFGSIDLETGELIPNEAK